MKEREMDETKKWMIKMASDCKERIKGKGLKKGRKKEQKIF